MLNAEFVATEGEPLGPRVDHRDLATAQFREQRAGDSNRPASRDQHALTRLHIRATHGVGSDGQELDHCRLVEGNAAGGKHELLWHADVLREPAVPMHAENRKRHAAVRPALAAGAALAAGDIRHDVHRLARAQGRARGRNDYLSGELVTHHPRIREVGLNTAEDVHVGAAHAHAPHAHQHFIGARLRHWPLLDHQGARLPATTSKCYVQSECWLIESSIDKNESNCHI